MLPHRPRVRTTHSFFFFIIFFSSPEKDGVIADALARELVGGSAACRSAVKAAFAELETRFDRDRASLQKTFNTCGAVVTDGDCFLLHDFVSDDFMGLVQYNNQMGAVNIASRCAEMLNATTGTAFDRLVKITRERSGKDCVYNGFDINLTRLASLASTNTVG